MRSALALSALLLLLPPLPSLSQDGSSKTTSQPTTTPLPGHKGVSTTTKQVTTQQVTTTASSGGGQKSAPSSPAATTSDPKGVQGSSHTTSTPTPTPTTPTPTPTTVPAKTTVPVKTETTSSQAKTQSSHSVTTSVTTTTEGNQATPQPPQVVNSPATAHTAPSATTPADTQTLTSGPVASSPPGSSSAAPSKVTAASGGPGATTGGTGTSQGTPAMSTPMVTSQGSHPISTGTPAVPGTISSATGTFSPVTGTFFPVTGTSSSKTPWPPVSSSGPVATPPAGPTSSSTHLAPTPPKDPNISAATPALETSRIRCDPPEKLTEKMLILNFTKTSLCTQNPETPLEDELVTLLCRAAKANFNPRQDQCHVRLVPVPESQAVAIKEITIQTNLLPQDVYESLKDKWDDLKEVGVSNMQLGDQGPPEETEDRFSMPLIITIVCMASFLLLVAALYGCCHQRLSQRKDQQRLTEELQTVENGYHDNPTLEVMETSSEMQEKKVNLNGELGDSWIVPLDNLIKDDLEEEEDTHL